LLHEEVLVNYMDDFVILAKIMKKTRRTNSPLFKNSRKTQSVFQEIKM